MASDTVTGAAQRPDGPAPRDTRSETGPAGGGGVAGADGSAADVRAVADDGVVADDAVGVEAVVSDAQAADLAGRRPLPGVRRAGVAVALSIGRDFRTVFSRPVALVREKKLMAFPGTLACVFLIALFAVLQHFSGGLTLMLDVAGVHQAEPLWEVLLQLPLSMFAPAPMLPAWGAMLQVALAFGISECWLGWRRMIMIAVLTSAVTSMAARVMVFVQTTFSIGTPEIDNWQLDTGPSVAVVALLVYLALRLRTYWIVAVTAVSMGGEAAILPNLAGREHLVAISLGFLTYFVLDVWGPAWRRRRAS